MNLHYGDWIVVRKIGSGSFGTVYEIERKSFGFCQKSALKVISIPQSQGEISSIRNTGMDEASIGEYYRDLASEIVKELIILEQLKGHTNIVSYEDHEIRAKEGEIGWDIYIRMELLTPLNQYLSCHEMGRNEVIRLGIDLCRALERCESQNIIHRDIKPDNIFLSNQGDGKLGDFGIARTVERTTSLMSKKGAYSFIAPEVYLGKPYGKTVDIYSLGLVLYRLLNYNRGPFIPPFPQPIKFQDQEQSLIRRVRGEKLPLPVLADQRMSEVVLKACSFEPGDRYADAKEMRIALQELLGKESPDSVVLTDGHEFNDLVGEMTGADNNDATICGSFPAGPEQHKKLISLPDDRTGSGHRTDTENSDVSRKEKHSEDRTVSGFHTEIEESGASANHQVVDDRKVSVFYANNGQPASTVAGSKGMEASDAQENIDDATVSIFSKQLRNNPDHPSGMEKQKTASAPRSTKISSYFKEKQALYHKEEEERKQKEKNKKQAKRNKKLILIAAVILAIFGLPYIFALMSSPSESRAIETIATGQAEEKEVSARESDISIRLNHTDINMQVGDTYNVGVDVKSNGYGYDLLVDYPEERFEVKETNSPVYNHTFAITPTLPTWNKSYSSKIIFKAVSKDDPQEVYDSRVLKVNVSAEPDAAILPDFTGEYYDIAYSEIRDLGLNPRIKFTSYKEGKTRLVAKTDPKATATLHKGDTVTLTVNGWVRDDIEVKSDKKKIDLEVGEEQKIIISVSGNLPDEYFLVSSHNDVVETKWGDWIKDNECECFITAKEPVDHDTILIIVYQDEECEEEALSAGIIEVNIKE